MPRHVRLALIETRSSSGTRYVTDLLVHTKKRLPSGFLLAGGVGDLILLIRCLLVS